MTLLDTGRAIIQTAQLGIILHAACSAWGNAIMTFFTQFDPAPCDKKSRSERQTLFPLFGEGLGMRLSRDDLGYRNDTFIYHQIPELWTWKFLAQPDSI